MATTTEIEIRLKKLQAKRLELESAMQRYKDEHRIEFWKPWPHQRRTLELLDQGKKVVLLQGGNRIGKTVLGACLVVSECLGKRAWAEGGATLFSGRPIRVRIIASDWEHHAQEVLVPKLKEWAPVGSYVTEKNNVGVEYKWTFPSTGSTIEFMTHGMETKLHESWSGHIVWFDEPAPKDKWIANRRGLLDFSGIALWTLTAVSEPWILDEIALSPDPQFGAVTEIPMRANPLLREEDISSYESNIPKEHRVARVEGGWLNLVGRVLPEFDKSVHLIFPFDVPTDWPVTAMIDFHLAKPQAISYWAVDQRGFKYTIGETWKNLSPSEVADDIIRKKRRGWRVMKAYIDPLSKGDTAYAKKLGVMVDDAFTTIQRKLIAEGIILEVATKDKVSGVNNLQSWLRGPNRMPIWYIFNDCERHIFEIMRWVYDTDAKGQPTNEPRKENDDMMENAYRFTLTNPIYLPLVDLSAPIQTMRKALA